MTRRDWCYKLGVKGSQLNREEAAIVRARVKALHEYEGEAARTE